MAISDELTRIQTAKADIKASIEAKGVTVPSDALIDQYADYVDEIQTGGGGGNEDLIDLIERDITTFNIPSGTTKIGTSVFSNCKGLTSITIPNSVTSIGDNVFQSCTKLTSITIPEGVTSIGNYAFSSCSNLTSVTIGSGVTSIGNGAFQSCTNLTSVTIPDSVTSIGQNTFNYSSKLINVTIGSGVTSIGQNTFSNCSALTSLTIEATTPPTLGMNALFGTNPNLVIYVPAESVEAYKAAWSTYASRIQAIPSE